MLEKITNQIGEYNYLFYDFILLMVLIVAIIIVTIIIIIILKKRMKSSTKTKDVVQKDISRINDEQNTKSINIIKERLAKGEISKEEYDKLKKEFEN
jgi:uncharacterized membrane protein